MTKLNNTSTLVDNDDMRPGYYSRNVRKIDNGYLVTETRENHATGVYSSTEKFVGKTANTTGRSSLKDALKYC